MKKIGETKIGKLTPKPHITYPLIRLPPEFVDVIGRKAQIFETEYGGNKAFLIVVSEEVIKPNIDNELEKRVSELENKVKELSDTVSALISSNGFKATKYEWGRRDLNSGHRLPKPGG